MCRGECREFGRELPQPSAHALVRGVLCVEGGRSWLRQQGCKEMVNALGVEKSRKLREDLWCRNAQRDNGDRDRLASRLGRGRSRGLKNKKVRTVRREDDAMRREERDLAFGGSRDLARVDSQHMGRQHQTRLEACHRVV